METTKTEMRVDESDKIVKVQLGGVIDLDERRRLRSEVLELCQANNLRSVLIDIRGADMKMSKADLYEFGEGFASQEVRNLQVATVTHPDDVDTRFLVKVILNRRVVIKEFVDVDAATQWLKDRP